MPSGSGYNAQSGVTTPVLYGSVSAGSNDYAARYCRWHREGNIVFYQIRITLSGGTFNSSGLMKVQTNIPYDAIGAALQPASYCAGDGYTLSTGPLHAYIGKNSSDLVFYQANDPSSGVVGTEFSNTLDVLINGFYFVV